MKKIVAIIFLFMGLLSSVSAQTVTKNNFPKDMGKVHMSLKMDFSQAVICGMNEEEFSKYEKDWERDKPTIVRSFRSGANLSLGKTCGIGDYKDVSYTILVTVNTITEEGYIVCDASISDLEGNVLFTVEEVTGGKEPAIGIGTKLSRMKVWATLTGKRFGNILKSELTNN